MQQNSKIAPTALKRLLGFAGRTDWWEEKVLVSAISNAGD